MLLLALSAAWLAPSTYPDVLDLLRASGAKPRVNLLLDASGSMAFGGAPAPCPWYVGEHNGGNATLTPSDQMKAALIGCASATDGILDRWVTQADLAITKFGSQTTNLAPFGSSLADLETGVLGVPANEWTRLTDALLEGSRIMDSTFSDAAASSCDTFFQILVTDGTPAGGLDRTYDKACVAPPDPTFVPWTTPQLGAGYLNTEDSDMMCSLSGNQVLRSHTIGLGVPGAYSPRFLQVIARNGGGKYFHARRTDEMARAFDSILLSVNARSNVFSGATIEQEGFFTGNAAYYSSYRPALSGAWQGNLHRVCVLPRVLRNGDYDTTNERCLFRSADGRTLVANPSPVDSWSGALLQDPLQGGHNHVLKQALGPTPSAPFYTKRSIFTWTSPGQLMPLTPTAVGASVARTQGCALTSLVAQIHGYASDIDCDTLLPTRVDPTPMADVVHGAPVILPYGRCSSEAGVPVPNRCFLAVATNEGLLKLVDAASGKETSALLPGDLWGDRVSSRSLLAELDDQPSSEFSHRYYLDTPPALDFEDGDADGYIDPGEEAVLWFGQGRGGRSRYVLDLASLTQGTLTAQTAVRSITPSAGGVFSFLRESWAKPWFGRLRVGATDTDVAVFGSGHVSSFDLPLPSTGLPSPAVTGQPGDRRRVACSGSGGLSELNGYTGNTLCTGFYLPNCSGNLQNPCYDGALVPLDHYSFPLGLSDGHHRQAAIRFRFSTFDLGPADELRIEDGQGNLAAAYRLDELKDGWTDWVYAESAILRLVTDGVDSVADGYVLEEAEWELGRPLDELRPSNQPRDALSEHPPMLYMVDLDKVQAALTAGPIGAPLDASVLAMVIARDCPGGSAVPCLDRSTAPDLVHFVCPVSHELTAVLRGDEVEALYFADECGQIFKYFESSSGTWTVKRLLNLNGGTVGTGPEYRKIFTRLEVIETVCTGEERTGIFFGTGDMQRAKSGARLPAPGVNDGRDVFGLLLDHPDAAGNWTQDDLEDRTTLGPGPHASPADPGWRIHFDSGEKVLRDPWVLRGQAFVRTFEPDTSPNACRVSSGTDRIYALDACTAAALDGAPTPNGRKVSEAEDDLGTGLLLIAPKDEGAFITGSNPEGLSPPKLEPGASTRPRLELFLMRQLP